ncbi:MYND-type domain-containing protein [Mycena indigotica]|uniref:MYND-type domain-containing protein n=1 Tax=Mycena indigotica TaxID=2126181 RepID=A0A8H6VQS6_9AGAR|nr:MYND-type domain-containing protein [Mycena indigotica]KAF7288601.1 MYND-type domain-containing protein [Mycena indigotica]
MHPLLNLANIDTLPPQPRERAKAAASGARDAVNYFFPLLQRMPGEAARPLVSVYYAALDPAPISQLERRLRTGRDSDLDAVADHVGLIDRVYQSLLILVLQKVVVPGCFIDLWARIFPWDNAIHAFLRDRDLLTPEGAKQVYGNIAALMTVIWQHSEDDFRGKLHSDSPGLGLLVGGVWKALVEAKYLEGLHNSGFHLTRDFGRNLWGSTERMHELVRGVGNRYSTLGVLLREHIKLAIPSATSQVDDMAMRITYGATELLTIGASSPETTVEFTRAVLEAGIVPVIVAAAFALGNREGGLARESQWNIFNFLRVAFVTKDAARWISEALDANFFPALFLFTGRRRETGSAVKFEEETLRALLDDILPGFTLHFSVLMQLRFSLDAVQQQLDARNFFKDAESLDAWHAFTELVTERTRLAEAFKATLDVDLLRACNNATCKKKGQTGDLKRCARCQTAIYCSKECQAADWKKRHKLECGKPPATSSLTAAQLAQYRAHDTAFLQTLILSDLVSASSRAILAPGLLREYHHDAEGPVYLLLDYTAKHGRCTVSIARTSPEAANGAPSANVQTIFARMHAGPGVPDRNGRWWKLTMAAAKFALGVEAKRVAGLIPAAAVEVDYAEWADEMKVDRGMGAEMQRLVGVVGALSFSQVRCA